MKKINYNTIMNTIDIASRIETVTRSVAIKLADHFTRSELKAAIRKGDPAAFMVIKGIGEKTAAKIIEGGKRMLALYPERVSVKKGYYMSPMFSTENTFDKETRERLEHVSRLTFPSTATRILNEIASMHEGLENEPFVATGVVEYNALSRSMLSDDLRIEMGRATDAVAIYRHNANGVIQLNKKLTEQIDALDPRDPVRTHLYDAVKRASIALLKRAVASGIVHNGVRYAFYTCSSGQLKKSSCYMMRSDLLKANAKRYWGGLTKGEIETNSHGAYIPMTKYFQYRALLTSSAVPSHEVFGRAITLDHCICVGEYEKNMTAKVMSISEDYQVSEGVRSDLAKNMFDGWFALDSRVWGDVVAQTRGYGIKGLGVPVDFRGYCEVRGLPKRIVDIDGVEHDLDKEPEISVILNTSVFKMKKFFGTWKNYVSKMRECGFTELYVCAIDEEEAETKQLSRQSLQTLFSVRDDELRCLAQSSVEELNSLTWLDHARDVLSCAGREYDTLSNFQKLIRVYPDAIKMPAAQKELRDRYYSLYNKAMCGKVNVNGKFYFVASDPYAWLDVQFGGKDPSDPSIGQLKAGEVCCNAYPDAKKLTLLRYPHIFMEWVVAENHPNRRMKGNAIYVSVHDLNDRVLQMDYDGDHLLVVDDPRLAEIAERTRRVHDVPVLYYEPSAPAVPNALKTDVKEIVNCIWICKDLDKVGQYTNLATTAWSFVNCNEQSDEEIHEALKVIATITAGVNHAVDAQKTFALNKLPDELIKLYGKLPWNQRYKVASGLLSDEDHQRADEAFLPQGDGVVDRVYDVVSPQVDTEYVMHDELLHFNWHMMEHPELFGFKYVKNVRVGMDDLAAIGSIEDMRLDEPRLSHIVSAIRTNSPIGLCDYLRLLYCLNSAFWAKKRKEAEGEGDGSKGVAENEWRFKQIRQLVVDFVRRGTPQAEGVDDETVLCFAARWALVKTMGNERKHSILRFLLDVFGDMYASAVVENERILEQIAQVEAGEIEVDSQTEEMLRRHLDRLFKAGDEPVLFGTAAAYLKHMQDTRTWKPGDSIAQLPAPADVTEPDVPFTLDYDVPVFNQEWDPMLDNELGDLS